MDITYTTKKLSSGNLQVRFTVEGGGKSRYGYLLVDGAMTDNEILKEINKRLQMRQNARLDMLKFSFKETWKDDYSFFLYSA